MSNQWWGVREGDSWGAEKNPEVGALVLQTVYSQWERGGGDRRGPLGWGRGMANLCFLTNWRAKGLGGGMTPPDSIRPLGVQEPGAR